MDVALMVGGLILLVAGRKKKDKSLYRGGVWVLVAGVVIFVASFLNGFVAVFQN